MKISVKFILSIFVCLVFITNSNSQTIDTVSINQTSNELFNLINENNFKEAAKLFHYPPSYTKKELEDDIVAVSKSLKLFSSEFGSFTLLDSLLASEEIVHVSIGGGDIPYWSKYTKTLNTEYPVLFSAEGLGYFIIKYCNVNNKIVIREIKYALPKNRDGAALKIQEVMLKLLQMHNQMNSEDSVKKI